MEVRKTSEANEDKAEDEINGSETGRGGRIRNMGKEWKCEKQS
jgi:hypothetical protein